MGMQVRHITFRDNGESLIFSETDDEFDESFQDLLRGPAGAGLRRAHLLRQLATRVFSGDYGKAQKALDTPHPQLNYRSASQAAETPAGMSRVMRLIARVDRPQRRGVGAFFQAISDGWRREFEPLLDLLPAAWGLSEEQFQLLLGARPPSLTDWQQHQVELDDVLKSRLARLRRLHEAFRQVVRPENYCEIWHTKFERGSVIGQKTLWEAYEDDGEPALDRIEAHFRELAGPF